MIRFYKNVQDKIECISGDDFTTIDRKTWTHLVAPDIDEVTRVAKATGLDLEILKSALDPEEMAHVDFDDDNLIILDIPCQKDDLYETVPFVIMYNKDYFVTLCSIDTELVDNVISKTKRLELNKKNRLSLQIMLRITALYILDLRKIDKLTSAFESRIKTSTKNQEIFELMNINKTLIYFSTSLNSNKNALLKLQKIKEFRIYEEDDDLMDDVILENNQAVEMCSIHRELLDGMMAAFASVTSNNLNIIMKLLAIVTLVISLPTLISSIYGMNVEGLPFAHQNGAFWIVLCFSLVFALVGAIVLIVLTNDTMKQKKKKK